MASRLTRDTVAEERPKGRVSKGGHAVVRCPPFETRASHAPQGEVTLWLNAYALKLHVQLLDLLGLGLGGKVHSSIAGNFSIRSR